MAPTTRQSASGSARSRVPVPSRTMQPRRKTSSSHTHASDVSWELLESAPQRHARRADDGDDQMETDEPLLGRPGAAQEILHPLRDMAERVGREVELFAETLDSWKPDADQAEDAKRKGAMGMVNRFRTIAQNTVSRLTKQHGGERKHAFSKAWKRSRKGSEVKTDQHLSVSATDDDNDPDPRAKTTLEDLEHWQAELDTWELLHGILGRRYPDPNTYSAEEEARWLAAAKDNDRFAADGMVWEEFLSTSDIARERLIVLRWLEATADKTENDLEIIEEQLEKDSGKGKSLFGQGWMDTREKIKGEKRLRLWDTPIDSALPEIQHSAGSDLLVTQLDLDAATRQMRSLENPDRHFESAFWTLCWEMLRRGRSMDFIREWCADRNELARAVSLGAYSKSGHGAISTETRIRWRNACCFLARTGGLTTHERAVYGLLSGDFEFVEKICRDWNDHLFASYNSSLLSQYQTYLLRHQVEQIPEEGQAGIQNSSNTLSKDNLSTAGQRTQAALQLKKGSRLDARQPLKLIQASIIGHSFEDFAMRQGVVLSRQTRQGDIEAYLELVPSDAVDLLPEDEHIDSVTDDPNALRILAHIIIIFQILGMDFGSDERLSAVENVITAYIHFLRLAGKINLIPLYASRLSEERATSAMARVLPDVYNPQERMGVLKLMEAYGLKVPAVLRRQYEFAMDFSPLSEGDDERFDKITLLESIEDNMWPAKRISAHHPNGLELDEEVLVRSMEWFLIVDSHWAMSFSVLTDVAKRFLNSGRIEAAVELYHRLSFIDVSLLLTKGLLGKAMDVMDEHEGSDDEITPPLRRSSRTRPTIKPDHHIRSAMPQRSKIFRDLLKSHARNYYEIGQLVTALEALWSWRTAEDSHLMPGNIEPSSVKRTSREYLEDLVSAMEPLLHDFLQHPGPAATAAELQKIRRLYLPEMILGYMSALHCAGHLLSREHLLQSMDLATNIANNEELVECFMVTGRMAELVDGFALTSKAMLRLNEVEGAKSIKKRRGKNGKNLGMWEVSA